ncbi:ankyrin repeat-containing domain protein [Immersiella caudata]|uniref:Ankyrin repeat-containing domain protein n=1 Tax=Immersiella caudata TaxID=314043 RepID=A0AA39XIB6_9PEZI|nr:ankyrin repeat-containing domain protein [Immersiella caudata]
MAANFLTTGIAALSLVVPTHALAGPDDWDDFSNNFATDLAPILVLFGEQASKQFLSESTSVWDCVIFGIAPIGVITAVVSAIRLYGSPSLKAFIGRAQEAHGVAEAELCSSTSDDVCELWSDRGICRVFGRPLILEFLRYTPEADDFYPRFNGRTVDMTSPPSCGMYSPRTLFRAARETRVEVHDQGENTGWPHPTKTGWTEVGGTGLAEVDKAEGAEGGKVRDFAPYPNLSLNIGIKPLPRRVLRTIAAVGSLLQVSFFGYATWVTFYYPGLYDEEGLPGLWSFCLATAGTAILVFGMICYNTTMFLLQPGNQRVGDQLFNAFAYSKSSDTYITSWKDDLAVESQQPGSTRLARSKLRLAVAVGCSCCGVICQFVGLRGLHGSVALYQLAVTLCMAIARALLRSRRLGAGQNRLRQRRDVEGHELDWQAMNLERTAGDEFKGGWYIDDVPTPLKGPNDATGAQVDSGVEVAQGARGLAGFHIQQRLDIDRLPSPSRLAVSWVKHNESDGALPNEAARILHYRASLAFLTGPSTRAEEEGWDTGTRAMAKQLKGAMQEAAEYVFSEMTLLKGWKESLSLVWSTTCRLHEPPTPSSAQNTTEHPESQPVLFSMYCSGGRWEISEFELEAALGLWSWSIRQLPAPVLDRVSKRKAFMAERREKRNDLISAIRLWVTQTRGILVSPLKLAALPDDDIAGVLSTVLSIPLMMTTAANTEDLDGLDGVCVSITSHSSLLQLVAQDIFGIFISRIADIMEPLSVAEPWTRRSQMSAFSEDYATADSSDVGLTNTHVRALAGILVSSGIGSREDALMTVIPPLLQRGKLPATSEVMGSLLRVAKDLRRKNKLKQAENLLRWLTDNAPHELQEKCVRALGNLYRNAVRSSNPSDQHFGLVGFQALEAMETLSDGRQMLEESRCTIQGFVQAWSISKTAKPSGKRPLRELLASLSDASALSTALCVTDTYDLHTARAPDVIRLLNWAVFKECPELIEDMWRMDRVRGLIPTNRLTRSESDTDHELPPLLWAIQRRVDAETLETLLDWPGLDLSNDQYGINALVSASGSGNYVAVDLLLQRGVRPHGPGGEALLSAVRERHRRVIPRLLSVGTAQTGEEYLTAALHLAVEWDNTVVRLLLDHGADPNALGEGERTALHVATLNGNTAAVEELLRHGARIDILDEEDASPLLMAVRLGHSAILQLFIPGLAPAGIRVRELLPEAVESGRKTILDLLLACRASPNTKDGKGRTPLLAVLEAEAVEHDLVNETIVERLLSAGARSNESNADNANAPLHAALRSGNADIISITLRPDYVADVDLVVEGWQTPLAVAVELGQPQSVELLLKLGANPNAKYQHAGDAEAGHVLHLATRRRHGEIVKLLLAVKADTEAKDQRGRTPLLVALECEAARHSEENETILESFLRAGADANAAVKCGAEEGRTTISALHLAVQSGNDTMVRLLTGHHANTEVQNEEGLTPLLAILAPCQRLTQQQREMVRILLAAGADGNATGGKYGNALQAAAHHGGEFLVHKLLQHVPKIDVNAQGGYFGSALQAAAAAWVGEEVVELLLDHGVSAQGSDCGSALLAALMNDRKKVVEILLGRGADTEATHPDSGLAALLVAVNREDVEMVSLLLRHNAKTESVDKKGRTALLLAVGTGNMKLIEVLLEGGADKEAKEPNSGRTPLLVASERGDYDIVRLLLGRGANVNAEGGIYGNVLRAASYRQDKDAEKMIKSFGGRAELKGG